nr:ABC transporter substrate-binding protein [Dysgonomonas sp. 520]
MIKFYFYLFLLTLSFSACKGTEKDRVVSPSDSQIRMEYAQGFTVHKTNDYTEITVRNPWDTLKVLQKYILVDRTKELPSKLPEGIIIRTPLKSVAAYSSIHCAALAELGVQDIITGVCEPDYINLPFVKKGISDNTIVNLGQAAAPDVEKAIMLSPEAILAAPIEGATFGAIEKTKIPIIQTPDYMEKSALGIAEWLRFYAYFVGKEDLADSLFTATKTNYNAIIEKTATANSKPSVMLDIMFNNIWYMAGGGSFVVSMLHDAGATYIWDDVKTTGSQRLSFESVLDKGEKSDFWLIKYNNTQNFTYNSLEKENKGYAQFDAFKNRSIYECNMSKANYYEDLTIHPDWILKDFAIIFHPDLFEGEITKYYKKMNE